MITKTIPAGTLLYGRAMLNQLPREIELMNAKNPVLITTGEHLKKARRAAKEIASGITCGADPHGAPALPLLQEEAPPPPCDFLVLAGGRELVEGFLDDPRPKAWVLLSEKDLDDFTAPQTAITVVDSRFIRSEEAVKSFMRKFAASTTAGAAFHPGELSLPKAFTYSCRTSVHSGAGALEELPGLLDSLKTFHPLILTDSGIRAVGLYDRLTAVLGDYGFKTFDEIPPDSSSRVVNEISAFYREEGCDGLIALGGGSVLDTGKGVYLNVSLGVEDLTSLAGSNRIPKLTVPFIAVPTTSGTGSEVTKVAVISDAERERKLLYVSTNLMPDDGILDPQMTASLPPGLTSITGMDALSHAVEAYTCLGKNPISDAMAWKAIELIRDSLIPLMTDPQNPELRGNLALASNLAGQAFSNSMVGMVHTIGHSVGAVCHAPHGGCMAVLLPASLESNLPEIEENLARLLDALVPAEERVKAEGFSQQKRALRFIEIIKEMNRNLRELTGGRHPEGLCQIMDREGSPLISREDFRKIAETSLGDASIVYNPVELRIDDILKVLETAYPAYASTAAAPELLLGAMETNR